MGEPPKGKSRTATAVGDHELLKNLTRNITQASPSSYTILYQYNLAGQLTTITDPNNNTLKFSSEALDHRFDRLYRWDHVSRIKEALSGAEARGEGATTNRPYKQLFSYDAMGHLTQRSRYRWFLGPDTSSDSYTNNRHDPVGQLWQYDADGNTVNMPGTGYVYDASGRIVTMTSGTPSTATLSGDGDEGKLRASKLSGISRRKRTSPPRVILFIQLCSGGC